MLNSFPFSLLVGTLLGFLSGLGVGGGSILILWLTLVVKTEPETARILNLMFFLPAATVSCLVRWKRGRISLRNVFPAILSGCCTAALFSCWRTQMDTLWLRKLFGILLLAIGLRELFYSRKNE